MEKAYKLSRIIIAIFMMMVSLIMLMNEDISVKIFGMSLFTSVAFLASFLGTRVSRKMQIGSRNTFPKREIIYTYSSWGRRLHGDGRGNVSQQ